MVIASRTPRLVMKHWLGGSLRYNPLDKMFREVSALIGRTEIDFIEFKLKTSRTDVEFKFCRGDVDTFNNMKVEFNRRINEDVRKGKYKFEMRLEPDFGEQGSEEMAEEDGEDSDDQYV